MDQINHHLTNSRQVLLATHVNPDGDAIGSLLALGVSLDRLGKTVTLYCDSPIPAVYRFLPEVARITADLTRAPAFDTAVVLDCGDLGRVGRAAPIVRTTPVILNIDHHITNTGFGHAQLLNTEACATAEIVYGLIQNLGVTIDTTIATAIYTGIFTDTGSFRFNNTDESAFAICNEMVHRGVDPALVARHLYGTYSLGRIKLLNLALDSIEIAAGGHLSLMTLSRAMLAETCTHPEDVDGLINYAKRIERVRMAALIQELESETTPGGLWHVSLRSDGSVDVSAIASVFGGGGHPGAAGFNITAPLPAVKERLIALAETLCNTIPAE